MREPMARLGDQGITVCVRDQPGGRLIEYRPRSRRVFVDATLTNEEAADGLWQVFGLAELDQALREGAEPWLTERRG